MSLRKALLGLLAEGSMTGYDLAKRFDHSLGRVWPARRNHVYTELRRLEQAGHVDAADAEGARQRRVYRLTPAGRQDLHSWLQEDPSGIDPGLRFDPLLRLSLIDDLPRQLRQEVLLRYERYFERQADWLDGQRASLPEAARQLDQPTARWLAAGVGVALYRELSAAARELRRSHEKA